MKKVTKKEQMVSVIAVLEALQIEGGVVEQYASQIETAIEFMGSEIALLEKRYSRKKDGKLSKAQEAAMGDVGVIVEVLREAASEAGKEVYLSAKEIGVACGFDYSSQKMTALMKKAVEQFEIEKGSADSSKKLVGYAYSGEIEGVEDAEEEEVETEVEDAFEVDEDEAIMSESIRGEDE